MLDRRHLTAPLATVATLVSLAVLAACSAGGPIPGGGYRVNEMKPEERQVLARPRFEQYPPYQIIAPEAVAPNLKSHPKANEFRTAIRNGAEKGPAFAGHLAVARWGCGGVCEQFAFVDARNGKVIWGPQAPYGAEFIQDSRLFVTNPPQNLPPDAPADLTRYFIWTGEELVEMRG